MSEQYIPPQKKRDVCPSCGTNWDYATKCCSKESRLESELEAIKKESLLLLNGFLESKVAEKCNEMEKELSAARKVVQAGAELIKRAELMCGYKHNLGDPPAIIQLKDLELALAAYDRVKGDK